MYLLQTPLVFAILLSSAAGDDSLLRSISNSNDRNLKKKKKQQEEPAAVVFKDFGCDVICATCKPDLDQDPLTAFTSCEICEDKNEGEGTPTREIVTFAESENSVNVTILKCKAQIPNESGKVIKFEGFKCFDGDAYNSALAIESFQTISASGRAELTCKFRN